MWYSHDAVNDIKNFINEDFVSLHPGAIPLGFKGLEDSTIALAYLDVDLYYPTKKAMEFILPRMEKGGVIVIDDCGDTNWPGVEKAINETRCGLRLDLMRSNDPHNPGYFGWMGKIQL
jgi:hypothetical protein